MYVSFLLEDTVLSKILWDGTKIDRTSKFKIISSLANGKFVVYGPQYFNNLWK